MSILFGSLVMLFIYFLPTMMCVYYKAATLPTVFVLIFNIIGFATMGLTWIIAFIIAMVSIKFVETLKSIGFCVVLLLIIVFLGVADVAVLNHMMGN